MDREFLTRHFAPHEQEQIAFAMATLASLNVFPRFSSEVTAQLAAGDPDESDESLLRAIRDIRRQVQVFENLHQIGLEYRKEEHSEDS